MNGGKHDGRNAAGVFAVLAGLVLLTGGCVSTRQIDVSRAHTEIRIVDAKDVYIGDERVDPAEVPQMLEDCGIPHDTVIYFKADDALRREWDEFRQTQGGKDCSSENGGAAFQDLRNIDVFRMLLLKAGYNKSVLVSDRLTAAERVKSPPSGAGGSVRKKAAPASRPKVRYRRSRE